ncbi:MULTISPECIES: hypothetical protein [Thermoanaerobacterium]|uniref:Uncharacterized protein n=3 Tax=Thermoanaerobacterium TaxID=28895 RepID=L0INX2_THETR|nr:MULTISPECIES: hypothetical protein [Thermoanaerobacterium]AFK94279.1 hypothetical protein Tsac_2732 [Thermoanaerobacterium saccharolyticum JW/SL-YS485]AGB20454.1 hypothetical protein Thethe_02907 [Thermoanaerobacterium thermosaccharolyticum M0795]ETO39072.1 hypothetical protein V518_0779 [Thermoanaerobacterium aotearoense SCUT27]
MLFFIHKQTIKNLDKIKSDIDKYKDTFNNLPIEDLILYEKAIDSCIEGFSLFNNSIFTAIFSFALGLFSSDLINLDKFDNIEKDFVIAGSIALGVLVVLIFFFKAQNESYIFFKKVIQLCIEEKEEQKNKEIEKRS